jgi:hypothetical protein
MEEFTFSSRLMTSLQNLTSLVHLTLNMYQNEFGFDQLLSISYPNPLLAECGIFDFLGLSLPEQQAECRKALSFLCDEGKVVRVCRQGVPYFRLL